MTIYLVLFGILALFGLLDIIRLKGSQKYIFIFLIFVLFILLDGLRWETGTDWTFYKTFFQKCTKGNNMDFEPGYVLINKFIYYISGSYSVFLIFVAFLMYSLYLKSINDYALYPLISSFFLYCTFIGFMGMNRQHIALGICLFSYRYIVSRKYWKFILCILIASLFHRTALIFFVTYFLNRNIPAPVLLISLLIVYLLNPVISGLMKPFLSSMPNQIEYKLNVYLHSEYTNSTFGTVIGSLKRALIFLPLYLNRRKLAEKFPNIELMLNIYFLSLLIYVLFNNSVQVFVSRGNLYFGSLFEIFLIPLFLLLVKKNMSQIIVYCLFLILGMLSLLKSISVFYDLFVPYKGLFINSYFYRVMH
jgi:hypothetical protein